ncbi:MAG: GH92 family glycosyl hydrolase [Alistipes sp.]
MTKHRYSMVALAVGIMLTSCCEAPPIATTSGLAAIVDPYIGSGGHGHVFVGASVPFGAIQAGPQNIHKGWDWCSGYHHSDSIVIGFSHTHLSGTGCTDMGDVLIMPFVGELRSTRGQQNDIKGSCSSYYSHKNESVSPGYYSLLMDNDVRAEMTTSTRTALHRITYPKGKVHRLLINLEEGNGDRAVCTYLKQRDNHTVEGFRFSEGWASHKVFFVLTADQPIQSLALFDCDVPVDGLEFRGSRAKGVLTFDDAEQVCVKVAISSVSCDNAMANLAAEIPGWNFAAVQEDAIHRWNDELGAISIETTDARAKKIFYTAMYHTFIAPTTYCDVNGEFRGHNDAVITADWMNYSTFSLWDTYRSLHPLFTLIRQDRLPDIVNSMLSIYDQQSKLPIWAIPGAETNCMPGYSAVPVISDAIIKGINNFDVERAYNALKKSTINPLQNAVPYVLNKGYIPDDKVANATSIAMEYAVGDWGVAQVAKKLGYMDDYTEYLKRGKYYAQYFDPSIKFVRPKLDNGDWLAPYDPFESVHGIGHFCEGNGWQYTFFVPQHPEGLISLMGGDEAFSAKLDEFFIAQGNMGEHASMDISGLIGMYAHGNEPSHHIAYLYSYAGLQWKTAKIVRYIQREFYTDGIDGIIGNEDCGQMSAWHILSALGFYQVNPSNGVFVFGSPLFDKATLNLPNGKTFEIVATNDPATNIYIQSVTLNGRPYEKSYITYNDIVAGGNLNFIMGSEPNKEFGAKPENRPQTVI